MLIDVDSSYGYVILLICLTWFMLNWMGMKVVQARRIYEVRYPKMYADHSDQFNCIQRAHQNTLENYPQFLVLLVFGGLFAPKLSALAGAVWVAGRVVYALGYYSGDPEKRLRGAFGYLGLLVLLGNTVLFALRLLGFF